LTLDDVGMIAADTSRTRAYLEAMIRDGLVPRHALVLQAPADRALPGQAPAATIEPLTALLARAGVPYDVFASHDINAPLVVAAIRSRPETVLVYSGYGGALLKADVLATGKKFLHVHGGYLPDYKGSTTNYYSLIAGEGLGASALFLSAEIDSGPVLLRRRFPAPADPLGIDHVHDSAARAAVLVETLRGYAERGEWRFELPQNDGGRTYYIIHPVLKHIAILGAQEATCA
jgi:methionyl-tRNA formyltransferase